MKRRLLRARPSLEKFLIIQHGGDYSQYRKPSDQQEKSHVVSEKIRGKLAPQQSL